MIIYRYLTRQVYSTMLAITAILLFSVVFGQLIHNLHYAVAGRHTLQIALELTLLQVPLLIAYVLVLGLFIGILLVYSRMYIDSEMTVLFACGLSRAKLTKLTLGYTSIIMLIVAFVVLWVQPKTFYYERLIIAKGKAAIITQMLTAGTFHSLPDNRVLYIDKTSEDKQRVFLAKLPSDKQKDWQVILSEGISKQQDEKAQQTTFLFNKGVFYSGILGTYTSHLGFFNELGIYLNTTPSVVDKSRAHVKLTSQLWQERSHNLTSLAELQMRLSMPLTVLILGLLAVPLSQVRSRQARHTELFISIFIYALYMISLFVTQNAVAQAKIYKFSFLGIHIIFASLALILFRLKR